MSKKKWIIGGAAVIAIVAATYLGRTLTGASSSKTSSSASGSEGHDFESGSYTELCSL